MEKYSRGGKHISSTKPISKNQYCVIAFRIIELGVGKIRQIYRVRVPITTMLGVQGIVPANRLPNIGSLEAAFIRDVMWACGRP